MWKLSLTDVLPLSSRSTPDSGLTVTLHKKRESFSVRLSSVVSQWERRGDDSSPCPHLLHRCA